MTYTRLIGLGCNKVIRLIVRGLALSKIHPNVLTFLGLLINTWAAVYLAMGQFFWGGLVIIGAGLFDMVDGRVARETNRVRDSAATSIPCSTATPISRCSWACSCTTATSIGRSTWC